MCGVPLIVAKVALTGQTSKLGSVGSPIALFTPDEDGSYRLSVCTEYAPGPNSMSASLVFEDALSEPNSFTFGGAAGSANPSIPLHVKGGQPISYYTDSPGTVPTYNLFIALEKLL